MPLRHRSLATSATSPPSTKETFNISSTEETKATQHLERSHEENEAQGTPPKQGERNASVTLKSLPVTESYREPLTKTLVGSSFYAQA